MSETEGNMTGEQRQQGSQSNPQRQGNQRRNRNDSSRTNKTNKPRGNGSNGFRGDTAAMGGFVFESPTRGSQLTETMEMLKRFVQSTYPSGPTMVSLFLDTPKAPEVKKPGKAPKATGKDTNGDPEVTPFDELLFHEEVKAYRKEDKALTRDLVALFSVIIGQCNEALRAQLVSTTGYTDKEIDGDCLWLLTEVRSAMTRFDRRQYIHQALHELRARFYREHQGQRTTVEYYHAFVSIVRTLDENLAWSLPPRAQDPSAALKGASDEAIRRSIRQRELATAFILNADNKRFGTLKNDLKTNFSRGTDQWPKTLLDAYNLLVSQERHDISQRPRHPRRDEGNKDNNTPTGTHPRGHAFAMVNPRGPSGLVPPELPRDALLLDSESSNSVFFNADLLTNLRRVATPLTLHSNGGTHTADQIGEFHGLGAPMTVWFNQHSMANILALNEVRRTFRVTLDTDEELAFRVHLADNTILRFTEHDSGLYVHTPQHNDVKLPLTAYSYLQTVAGNRSLFPQRELKAADTARTLYRHLGRPSHQRFLSYIANGHVRNCPITAADAKRAQHIYGHDVAYLKGKRTQRPPLAHVPTTVFSPLPDSILAHHSTVTLCVDLFYVQKHVFLHCVSRKLGYRSSTPIPNRNRATLLHALQKILALYARRGFHITAIHADHEFECLKDSLASLHTLPAWTHLPGPITMDICTPNDHVKEVERSIRTVKETLRATVHGLPYKRLPRQLIRALVAFSTDCWNAFPLPGGVSSHLSPDTIVTGRPSRDYHSYLLEFGSYALLTDRTTNTPRSRAFGAIALTHTGNQDNSYRFLSLVTGEIVTKAPGYWTEVPISDAVIARVEAMALAQGEPLLQDSNLLSEYSPDQPIDPDSYDPDYHPPASDDPSDHTLDSFFEPDDPSPGPLLSPAPVAPPATLAPGPGLVDPGAPAEETTAPDDAAIHNITTPDDGAPSIEHDTDAPTDDPIEAPVQPDDHTPDDPSTHQHDTADAASDTVVLADNTANSGAHDLESPGAPLAEPETPTEPTGTEATHEPIGSYNLRQNRGRSYDHRLSHSMDNPVSERSYEHIGTQHLQVASAHETPTNTRKIVHGWVMTQMSARAGIRRFGDAARDAMRREFQQLDNKGVFDPIRADALSPATRKQALRCINIIKEKRDGKIKGRTCADGRPQRLLYDKADTSSPTASSDAIMLTLMVDAIERRDVATADVAGAYLNAEMDDFVLMKLTGEDVQIMCDVNPSYAEYVTDEQGKVVLYLRLARALYGCVRSAMLWYKLFVTTLKGLGFKLNPYDSCVANATIDGSQCTIVWYVDDNKVSHIKAKVVSDIITKIENHFGKMTVTRGDEHEFLGMNIVFDKQTGTASISMASYITEAIQESGMDIRRSVATPAMSNLFQINDESTSLTQQSADLFRRIVCKLLYVGMRARTDILTALSFLTTRITKATIDDYRKLKRLLEYLYGTIDLRMVLGADDLSTAFTWVDASYAVHDNMRSHTGGVISFGTGGILCKSNKQKLNTKSSTEAEVVGASDYLPNTLWVMHFMDAQGYPIKHSLFAQDNQSAIRLEKNGRASAGQKSRHINIRHFWITDRIRDSGLRVVYCPTESMLADFFTKPLQGSLFRLFRDVLLGRAHISALFPAPFPSSSSKERVEVQTKSTGHSQITWADLVRNKRSEKDLDNGMCQPLIPLK